MTSNQEVVGSNPTGRKFQKLSRAKLSSESSKQILDNVNRLVAGWWHFKEERKSMLRHAWKDLLCHHAPKNIRP